MIDGRLVAKSPPRLVRGLSLVGVVGIPIGLRLGHFGHDLPVRGLVSSADTDCRRPGRWPTRSTNPVGRRAHRRAEKRNARRPCTSKMHSSRSSPYGRVRYLRAVPRSTEHRVRMMCQSATWAAAPHSGESVLRQWDFQRSSRVDPQRPLPGKAGDYGADFVDGGVGVASSRVVASQLSGPLPPSM